MYTKNKIKYCFVLFFWSPQCENSHPPKRKRKKKEAEPSGVRTLVETLVEKEKPTYLIIKLSVNEIN